MLPELLTTTEAADYVRLGKPTLDRFRLTGEGPPFAKLGGAVRYRKTDLDDWVSSRLVSSTSELRMKFDVAAPVRSGKLPSALGEGGA